MRQVVIRIVIPIAVVVVIALVGLRLLSSRDLATGETLSANDTAQIAFLSGEAGSLYDLYVYDHATQSTTQLTSTSDEIRSAVWSPDGRYLAFHHDPENSIYRLDVATGDVLRLTPADSPGCGLPLWSPDGTQLVCQAARFMPGDGEMYLVQADGNGMTLLAEGTSPSWSADGTRLIYSINDDPGASNPDSNIAAIDVDTGTPETLLELDGIEDHPVWSPDESMVAYVEKEYLSESEGFLSDTLKIWDGDTEIVVAEGLLQGVRFQWSPDGTTLRFLDCQYDVAANSADCRDDLSVAFATDLAYDVDDSLAAALLLNIDDDRYHLCINPNASTRTTLADCVEFPDDTALIVGWRPS